MRLRFGFLLIFSVITMPVSGGASAADFNKIAAGIQTVSEIRDALNGFIELADGAIPEVDLSTGTPKRSPELFPEDWYDRWDKKIQEFANETVPATEATPKHVEFVAFSDLDILARERVIRSSMEEKDRLEKLVAQLSKQKARLSRREDALYAVTQAEEWMSAKLIAESIVEGSYAFDWYEFDQSFRPRVAKALNTTADVLSHVQTQLDRAQLLLGQETELLQKMLVKDEELWRQAMKRVEATATHIEEQEEARRMAWQAHAAAISATLNIPPAANNTATTARPTAPSAYTPAFTRPPVLNQPSAVAPQPPISALNIIARPMAGGAPPPAESFSSTGAGGEPATENISIVPP